MSKEIIKIKDLKNRNYMESEIDEVYYSYTSNDYQKYIDEGILSK